MSQTSATAVPNLEVEEVKTVDIYDLSTVQEAIDTGTHAQDKYVQLSTHALVDMVQALMIDITDPTIETSETIAHVTWETIIITPDKKIIAITLKESHTLNAKGEIDVRHSLLTRAIGLQQIQSIPSWEISEDDGMPQETARLELAGFSYNYFSEQQAVATWWDGKQCESAVGLYVSTILLSKEPQTKTAEDGKVNASYNLIRYSVYNPLTQDTTTMTLAEILKAQGPNGTAMKKARRE